MSFYGTFLNNYPESYEPNLGRLQAVENKLAEIDELNTKISENINDIKEIDTKIDTTKQDIYATIVELRDGVKYFRTNEFWWERIGNFYYQFNLENASSNDIVIVQPVGFTRYGEISNFHPVITKIIYNDGSNSKYSAVSVYVELPENYRTIIAPDDKLCIQGLIIDKNCFGSI